MLLQALTAEGKALAQDAMTKHAFRGLVALLLLTSMLLACAKEPPPDLRVERFAKLPKWDGLWIGEHQQPDINGFPPPNSPPSRTLYKLAGFEAPGMRRAS